MSRSIFGWSLPPGCTTQDIERAAGGDEPVLPRCDCGAWLPHRPERYEDVPNMDKPCAFGMRCPDGGDAYGKAMTQGYYPFSTDSKEYKEILAQNIDICNKCEKVEGYGQTLSVWNCKRCGRTVKLNV